MQPASCLFTQSDIAFNLPPFALGADTFVAVQTGINTIVNISAAKQTVYLAMLHNNTVCRCYPLHRLTHQPFVLNATTIVRKTRHQRSQLLYINEFTLALLAEGDTCIRMDANAAVTRNDSRLRGEMIKAVWRRKNIGHGKHVAIARASGSRATREDSLFISEARLTEMHMQIH